MTANNGGVRSKLNSKYYNKLTKAERDAFFNRWMNYKDTSIWAEARKIQAERSKKPNVLALPAPATAPALNKSPTRKNLKAQAAARRVAALPAPAPAPAPALNKSPTRKNLKAQAAAARRPNVPQQTRVEASSGLYMLKGRVRGEINSSKIPGKNKNALKKELEEANTAEKVLSIQRKIRA